MLDGECSGADYLWLKMYFLFNELQFPPFLKYAELLYILSLSDF